MEKAAKIRMFSVFFASKWFGILVIQTSLVLKPRDTDVGFMPLFLYVGSFSTGSFSFLSLGSALGDWSMESLHWFHT